MQSVLKTFDIAFSWTPVDLLELKELLGDNCRTDVGCIMASELAVLTSYAVLAMYMECPRLHIERSLFCFKKVSTCCSEVESKDKKAAMI